MLTNYMQTKTKQLTRNAMKGKTQSNLIVSYDIENYYSLLSHISQYAEQRWILFIAPPGRPNFTFLQESGINKSQIITLPQSKIGNHIELLKTALHNSSYSTVITWLNECDTALQNELNELAMQSNSKCFVYCAH